MAAAEPVPTAPARTSRWRVLLGVLWALVAAGCAVAARGSLLASHPAYGVILAAVLLVGREWRSWGPTVMLMLGKT